MLEKKNSKQFLLSAITNFSKFFRAIYLIVFAKVFGPADLGMYVICWACVEILSKFSVFGMSAASLPFLNKIEEEYPHASTFHIVHTIAFFGTVFALGISMFVFYFAQDLAVLIFKKRSIGVFLEKFIWVFPFFTCNRIYNYMFRHLQNLRFEMYTQGFIDPLIVLILVLLLKGPLGIQALTVAHFFALGATTAFFAYASLTQFKRKQSLSEYLKVCPSYPWKAFFKNSASSFINNLTVILGQQMSTVIVGRYMPLATAGVYAICFEIVGPIRKLYFISEPVIEPIIAKTKNRENLSKDLSSLMQLIVWLFLMVFALYLSFGIEILSAFGQEYVVGYRTLIILALAQLFFLINKISESTSFMSGFSKTSNMITISTLVLAFVLSYLFIPLFGIIGAGLANLLTYFIASVLSLQLLMHHVELSLHPYGNLLSKAMPLILILISTGLLMFSQDFLESWLRYLVAPTFIFLVWPHFKAMLKTQVKV